MPDEGERFGFACPFLQPVCRRCVYSNIPDPPANTIIAGPGQSQENQGPICAS
jgi:hypothetical protein